MCPTSPTLATSSTLSYKLHPCLYAMFVSGGCHIYTQVHLIGIFRNGCANTHFINNELNTIRYCISIHSPFLIKRHEIDYCYRYISGKNSYNANLGQDFGVNSIINTTSYLNLKPDIHYTCFRNFSLMLVSETSLS